MKFSSNDSKQDGGHNGVGFVEISRLASCKRGILYFFDMIPLGEISMSVYITYARSSYVLFTG